MIRPTELADSRVLVALATQTGVFKPHEMQALEEVLADYFAGNKRLGHHSVTFEEGKEILGFAYYAPAAMPTFLTASISSSARAAITGLASARP